MTHRLTWTPPGTRESVHIPYPTHDEAERQAIRISAAFGGVEVAVIELEEDACPFCKRNHLHESDCDWLTEGEI